MEIAIKKNSFKEYIFYNTTKNDWIYNYECIQYALLNYEDDINNIENKYQYCHLRLTF